MILALDCSLLWTAVSVFDEGLVLSAEQLNIGRRQAMELPSIVERTLAGARRTFDDTGLVAVTNGPGYFTGIRIGVSYAAALAFGLGVKVVAVSALHALAYPHISRPGVLAVVYAGRGFVYAASFGCDADNLPSGEYQGNDLEAWLSRHKDVTVLSDDPSKLADTLPLFSRLPDVRQALPDASNAASIAWRNRDIAVHPTEVRVSYHRAPQIGR